MKNLISSLILAGSLIGFNSSGQENVFKRYSPETTFKDLQEDSLAKMIIIKDNNKDEKPDQFVIWREFIGKDMFLDYFYTIFDCYKDEDFNGVIDAHYDGIYTLGYKNREFEVRTYEEPKLWSAGGEHSIDGIEESLFFPKKIIEELKKKQHPIEKIYLNCDENYFKKQISDFKDDFKYEMQVDFLKSRFRED